MRGLQAKVVDVIKRRAIGSFHAKGKEAQLLEMYLWAEEAIELEGMREVAELPAPAWLKEQLARHTSDEARHAAMLRRRLLELGVEPRRARVDPVSRYKLRRLRAIARAAQHDFTAGLIVAALAVAWRMEIMGVRVIGRHVSTLAHTAHTETQALLERILADERAHVAACEAALSRLVSAAEQAALDRLVARIDRVERSFGISGALLLLAAA